MQKIAFLIYYNKQNFYSLNAIAGALETDAIFEDLDIYFMSSKVEFLAVLEKISKQYEKIIAAISFFTTQLFETHNLVKTIKNRCGKNCLLVAGGSHPTGDSSGTLKIGFDIVVVGEGEETIIECIHKIGSNNRLREVKGIAYLNEENKYIFTGKRNLIDLNKY
ncbi:MAG: cobalamin-dependent protein, partial [Candidatus Thorarchaeota archaeon]